MLTRIKKKFFPSRMLFSEYGFRQSAIAHTQGCFSRSANYATAIRSFTAAVGQVTLRQVTAAVLDDFQLFMQQRGICRNTISCYNRTLRAIYNRAVGEGLVSDRRPFSKVYTGRPKTVKRSITENVIRRIEAADLTGVPQLQTARDYFLFGFYAMGMPFVDMACLRREQIIGGMLVYHRRKTEALVTLPLSDEAMAIIRKYDDGQSPFVFPIITRHEPFAAYQQYCARLNAYNRDLKQIALAAGVKEILTSYTVRHSWASIAYKTDVPLKVIAQALGHHSTDMTMTYIRELDTATLRDAGDRVLRAVRL